MSWSRMKLLLGIVFLTMPVCAQISLNTKDTYIEFDKKGYYKSIKVDGEEILLDNFYPVISVMSNDQLLAPVNLKQKGNTLDFMMPDKKIVTVRCEETPTCIVLKIVKVPEIYDALYFGPFGVSINDIVGDVVGVAQGRGLAFGVQALNIKTNAGIPKEYFETLSSAFKYDGKPTELSVEKMPVWKQAAATLELGAMFQFTALRRDKEEHRKVLQVEDALVLPVKGEDAKIEGASVALFGSKQSEALVRIGEIELELGLPHPMLDGEWMKTSRASMKSYLITDFTEENLDEVLDKAKLAGFTYVYNASPFADWGHFNWSNHFTKDGDEGVRRMVEKADKKGFRLGIHTLSNFMTTNDAYVTPIPSSHLLKQGILKLESPLSSEQTEIVVKRSSLFAVPMTLNALQIEDELITFGKVDEFGDKIILKDCKRGAFGTKAVSHDVTVPLYKLWDYPYKNFFPDLELQDAFADRLSEIFNNTGLSQISFDGLEGCTYTGQGEYATSRFVSRFYQTLKNPVINDASRLNHNLWHIHTRMNWGEPWGESMRTGQVENRIKNQEFFQRNLFPRMLGWFLIRLADRKFECTTLEDLEWALSESAGFDAGYAMNINVNTLRKHGQIDKLLDAIKNWDLLRENQCFTSEQMERLRDPKTEWHLEKKNETDFLLYPLDITKPYHCDLGELQPGQPGGADWSIETSYGGNYAFRLKVEGEGQIENPQFMTDKGVILFPCTVKEGQYLLYSFDGTAQVTDKNFNILEMVSPQGEAQLPSGSSHVAFSCNKSDDDYPDVLVRFITRGKSETIKYVIKQ